MFTKSSIIVSAILWTTGALGQTTVAETNSLKITESEVKEYYQHTGEAAKDTYKNAREKRPLVQKYTDSKMLEILGEKAKIHETNSFKKRMSYARMIQLGKAYIDFEMKKRLSDEHLKKVFNKNPGTYSTKRVRVSSIATSKKKLATQLTKRLNPEKFPKFAAMYSDDLATKKIGGDMGYITRGFFKKEVEDRLFNMKKNEIVKEPIVDNEINYIFMVTDIQGTDNPKFEDVKHKVYASEYSKILADTIIELRKESAQKILVKDTPNKSKK